MIKIQLPKSPEKLKYLILGGFLIPQLANDESASDVSEIPFRADISYIQTTKSLYGENDVHHVNVKGNLSIYPFGADLTPNPSTYRPNNQTLRARLSSNNSIVYRDVDYGFVQSVHYSFFIATDRSASWWTHVVGFYEKNKLRVISLSVDRKRGDPTWISSGRDDEYTVLQNHEHTVDINFRHRTFNNLPTALRGKYGRFDRALSALEIISIADQIRKETAYVPSDKLQTHQYLKPFTSVSANIQDIRSVVNRTVRDALESKSASIVPEDFGVLAQRASEKLNANKVNMLEFIAGLKNPKQMIPKLKALRDIKTHAGNYLSVQYGILPTISDLQNIYAAFKKAAPFQDKNGYSVYTDVVHARDDSREEHLEQRLKLAIADDDDRFQGLLRAFRKIESSGFAPTLSNIWDLVPYSFAIDWFVGIGDLLDSIDARCRIARLKIKYVTMSQKYTTRIQFHPSGPSPISGTLDLVRYHRWTTRHCPVPPITLSTPNLLPDRWLEATALIIQRTK